MFAKGINHDFGQKVEIFFIFVVIKNWWTKSVFDILDWLWFLCTIQKEKVSGDVEIRKQVFCNILGPPGTSCNPL